jgi:hypothetical protein
MLWSRFPSGKAARQTLDCGARHHLSALLPLVSPRWGKVTWQMEKIKQKRRSRKRETLLHIHSSTAGCHCISFVFACLLRPSIPGRIASSLHGTERQAATDRYELHFAGHEAKKFCRCLRCPVFISNYPRGSKVWTICMHLGMHALRASDHAICGLTRQFIFRLISEKFRQSMGNSR